MKTERRILVTGAVGQIGSELAPALRERYGSDNVVAAGHRTKPSAILEEAGPFEIVDVCVRADLERVIDRYRIDTIYHMAAILSAAGEKNPALAWSVNMDGLRNILDVARERKLRQVFVPSSIAAFGPETPRQSTPQETVLRPRTIYGVTKVAGELLGDYYARKLGVDVRGLRYPGIISSVTPPSGGTTDYAVEIFYAAVEGKPYTCFLREDTILPMMYMPDCIKATIDLMEADAAKLRHHCDFNVAAMSFSAGQLAAQIRKHVPTFVCSYQPDSRQSIADSWPQTIDDAAAREEWGWKPTFGFEMMIADMLEQLGARQEEGKLWPEQAKQGVR